MEGDSITIRLTLTAKCCHRFAAERQTYTFVVHNSSNARRESPPSSQKLDIDKNQTTAAIDNVAPNTWAPTSKMITLSRLKTVAQNISNSIDGII